jgi:DNA modification methylase
MRSQVVSELVTKVKKPAANRREAFSRGRGTRSRRLRAERPSVARTQAALYDELAAGDLHLSWSEAELPERERTKHVHRLHPYLGKFVPQLVEALLGRYVRPGGRVLDPFAGSGTTLVQALESGYDAVGVDVAAFNCLLMRVKTATYDPFTLGKELREADSRRGTSSESPSEYVAAWFAPQAAAELLHFASQVDDYEHADVLRVVLARAARSARLTTHFDLEFPRQPQRGPYWCHKHRRVCRPVQEAGKFLARYLADTLDRLEAFQRIRDRRRGAHVIHGDARQIPLHGPFDGVVTSPPYPGLIDYHEQHRYAYELFGLDDRRDLELGAAERGRSRGAIEEYRSGIAEILGRCAEALAPGAPVIVVVNDRRDLYPGILARSGLRLVDRLERHVNRRTGRRAGEYFESILIARR